LTTDEQLHSLSSVMPQKRLAHYWDM